MNKSNFEQWTKDEMRAARRHFINVYLQVNRDGKRKYSSYQVNVKRMVRDMELHHYGIEMKAYYYYEYHK